MFSFFKMKPATSKSVSPCVSTIRGLAQPLFAWTSESSGDKKGEKSFIVQPQQKKVPPHKPLWPPLGHCSFPMGERTQSGKYKQRDGCVEGNYLPEPLARGQQEDIHLFRIESGSRDEGVGVVGGGWDGEWDRTECEAIADCEAEPAREGGSGATTSESFKPVIASGDAKQAWSSFQHVEGKPSRHHGSLQSGTDLTAAARGSASFLCGKRCSKRKQ